MRFEIMEAHKGVMSTAKVVIRDNLSFIMAVNIYEKIKHLTCKFCSKADSFPYLLASNKRNE